MNKNIIIQSLILSGLVIHAQNSFAQKPTDPSGKTSTPRTDTVTVTTVLPPNSNTTTGTNTTTATNTSTSSNTGSNTNTGTNTSTQSNNTTVPVNGTTETGTNTTTGVQGTSTTPTDLGNTSQVGGVNQTNTQGGGKGGKGKKGKQIKTPNPATQTNIVVPVNGISGASTETASNTSTSTSTQTQTSNATVPVSATTETGTSTGTTTTSTTQNTGQPSVSGSQTVQQDGVTGKPCEDEAVKELYKIMSSDQNNAFAKMVELTTMKLARKALVEGNATLEGYTQTKIGELEGYFNKSKEAGATRDKVVAAYEVYGKGSDAAKINQDLDAALAKGKKACYWSSKTHLANNDVAAYVLAMSAADANSGLSDADAATVWALDKIRVAAKSGGNLEITNRVARYLGAIQGGTAMTKEELDKAIADQEQELVQITSKAYASVKTNLFECIDQANPSCSDCAQKQKEKFENDHLGLSTLQRGLASAVIKSDNVKMVNKFKGKAGEIDFSLDNITRGSVQKDPSRLKGFDACGTPVVSNSQTNQSNTSGGGLPQDYNCVNGQCYNPNGGTYVATNDGIVYDNGTSPESSITMNNPYGMGVKGYTAAADATYVAPRYTYPTGEALIPYSGNGSAAGKALTKITSMLKTQDGCQKLGGIWTNNHCEIKDPKTGKATGQLFAITAATAKAVLAKVSALVKTPAGCANAGGVWNIVGKRCDAKGTYQAFYDRDPVIRTVKDFVIPAVKTVVTFPYVVAKKHYHTMKDYVLPTLGQAALWPYNVAVKTSQTVYKAAKRNPAATKSIVTNSLIPGWNMLYYTSPWGLAYDTYQMMK